MAQALLQHMLDEQGLTEVAVRSAGIAADCGAKASPLAAQALQELGIDLTQHRAQSIESDLVSWADLILTMTRRHKEFVVASFPVALEKTHVLKEFLADASESAREEQALYELHAAMAAKRDAFAAAVRPNIRELQVERARLLQELQEVEQLLAERQAELLERVRSEREAIERIERGHNALDVVDPFGQPLAVYRASRDELRAALSRLVEQLSR